MNGKGDKDRTSDRETYRNNFEEIFGMNKQEVMRRARESTSIHHLGGGQWEVHQGLNIWTFGSKRAAYAQRAQLMINKACELRGVAADVNYVGGKWENYL